MSHLKFFSLAILVFLTGAGPAWAGVDLVRVTLQSGNADGGLGVGIDHKSQRDPAWTSPHWIVEVRCADGKDTPVAFVNESDWEIGLISTLGVAKLAPAKEIGAHAATFRSVPKGDYIFQVKVGGLSGETAADIMLVCANPAQESAAFP